MEDFNKNEDVIKNLLSIKENSGASKDGKKKSKLSTAGSKNKVNLATGSTMMKAISKIAHQMRLTEINVENGASDTMTTAFASTRTADNTTVDELNADASDLVLSHAILRTDWNDDKRLEPQLVLDYIESVYDTDDIFVPIKRNIEGTFLIVVSPVGSADLTLRDLSTLAGAGIDLNGNIFTIDHSFPYIDQPSALTADTPLIGTGFLVAKNLVATAGHVVSAMRRVLSRPNIFGQREICIYQFRYVNNQAGPHIRLEKVSTAVDIINSAIRSDQSEASFADWALLKVQLIQTRKIVPLEIALKPFCGEEVYCLGHGLGLPLKMSWYGMIYQMTGNRFFCKLETFGGNSGSPVFDATSHKVVGIISGGSALANEFIQTSQTTVVPATYLEGYDGASCTSMIPVAEWLIGEVRTSGI